jgi:mannosyltransferase OCH1-like enzyme
MSIPKIIHYCWFGPKEIPEMERTPIKSWSEKMPDYKIMFWNEETFDVNSVKFTKQAYEHEKYAFVSDYARLYALYTYGGVYFDTDVEVVKSLEPFMEDDVFIGFENKTMIAAGIIGAKKEAPLFKEMMEHYHEYDFEDKNGNIDTTTIVQILTKILETKGIVKENREQLVDGIHIYERDIFYPKKMDDGTFRTTERTFTIHRYAGSWLTERERKRGVSKFWRNVCRPVLKKIREILTKLLGDKRTKRIEAAMRKRMR